MNFCIESHDLKSNYASDILTKCCFS